MAITKCRHGTLGGRTEVVAWLCSPARRTHPDAAPVSAPAEPAAATRWSRARSWGTRMQSGRARCPSGISWQPQTALLDIENTVERRRVWFFAGLTRHARSSAAILVCLRLTRVPWLCCYVAAGTQCCPTPHRICRGGLRLCRSDGCYRGRRSLRRTYRFSLRCSMPRFENWGSLTVPIPQSN
jgi:hypothetical protein